MRNAYSDALRRAVGHGLLDMVNIFLDMGAKIDKNDDELFSMAVKSGNLDLVKLMLKYIEIKKFNYEVCRLACSCKSPEMIDFILNKCDNTNLDFMLFLSTVESPNPEVLKMLLKRGARPSLELIKIIQNEEIKRILKPNSKRAQDACI